MLLEGLKLEGGRLMEDNAGVYIIPLLVLMDEVVWLMIRPAHELDELCLGELKLEGER